MSIRGSTIAGLLAFVFVATEVADAESANVVTELDVTQSDGFRFGIIAGEPLGVSLILPVLPRFALQAEFGYSTRDDAAILATFDLLWRVPELLGPVGTSAGFVFWTGVGVRFSTFLTDDQGPEKAGIRIPVGVSYLTADGTIELFIEVAPALNFAPELLGTLAGGVGMRVGL